MRYDLVVLGVMAMGFPGVCAAVTVGPVGWEGSGAGGAVATHAGLVTLAGGGNAADSAAATILALSVTDYGSFCIGGEVPVLVYDAKAGRVRVLCGLGRAPLDPKATAWFLPNGVPLAKDKANLKSACVPTVIDLCMTLLKLYGTRMISLNNWADHPNCVEPGKRPSVTLTPPAAATAAHCPVSAISRR